MAEIKFYANILGDTNGTLIEHTLGSGIGFYGSSFGISVPVGSQQQSTYVTNANGTTEGARLNNTSMVTSGTLSEAGRVSINGGESKSLNNLPNYLCPLNIRFSHNTPVRVQNCKLRIFDRNNIANAASGVTTWVYEARHPSTNQTVTSLGFRANKDNTASEGYRWAEFDLSAAGQDMSFTNSPGVSGLNTDNTDASLTQGTLGWQSNSGINLVSTRHDWYVALSSQPESIGAKTNYGLYFTVEYL
jgi:hypothetical protein